MHIRPFNHSDREQLTALLRHNTPAYFSPEEERDLEDYFDNHLEKYYVVIINDAIYGCGGFNLSKDGQTAMLSWDIIHPEYHGKGLGTALTHYRIQQIRQIDAVRFLSVRTSQLVYRFYTKFGLELRETIKDYWSAGFDMYRLDCPIERVVTASVQ